jgi:hypothetical protein
VEQKSPSTRTFAYNRSLRNPDDTPGPAVTLNDVLAMGGLAPDATVKDYMDVKGGKLCYTY